MNFVKSRVVVTLALLWLGGYGVSGRPGSPGALGLLLLTFGLLCAIWTIGLPLRRRRLGPVAESD